MGRPKIERGADWFRHDVGAGTRGKYAVIVEELGCAGYGILNLLLETIYGGDGYFMPWDERDERSFARRVALESIDVVKAVIELCFREGVFDRKMFERHKILTSADIQEDYFYIVSKRKSVSFNPEFLLVAPPVQKAETVNSAETPVNSTETPVNSAETPVNSAECTQSKSKSKSNIESKSKRYSISSSQDNNIYILSSSFDDDDTPQSGRDEPCFAQKPDYAEVLDYCDSIFLSPVRAEELYSSLENNDFCDQSGRPIRDWRAIARKWKSMDAPPLTQAKERRYYSPENTAKRLRQARDVLEKVGT